MALVGAGAAAILAVIVPDFEGTRLIGYRDPVGIPTKCMTVAIPYRPRRGPLHLVIDSTGLKVLGEGD